ncbi:MAG: hypothetical protein IKH71_08705, partial [Oscillospiraceae bacterium]|nr:hypothetical protein [Oscillospiraceae bacterium]
MNINGNTRCYVWDDITNVEYVSIIDGEGKEIIYPITAETERIVTKMEGAQLSTKRKDFWDAKNELYYYRNRLGNFYKVKKVDQTESFSINYYDLLMINMDFTGTGGSNARGWQRDSYEYFDKLLKMYPKAFSTTNTDLIKNRKGNPKIDVDFLNFLPEEYRKQYANYIGQELIHHHAGEGGQAFAVPAGVHVGYGGVHNAEKQFGITANADIQTRKIQQAFDAGFIAAGNDIWQALESDTKFDRFVINGISTSKTKYEFIQELKTDKEILDIFDEFKKIYTIKISEIPVFDDSTGFDETDPDNIVDDVNPEEFFITEAGAAETISEIENSKEKIFLVKVLFYILNKEFSLYNNPSADYDINSVISAISDKAFQGIDEHNNKNKIEEYKRLCQKISNTINSTDKNQTEVFAQLNYVTSDQVQDVLIETSDIYDSELQYSFFLDTNVDLNEADKNDNHLIDKNEAVALYLAERDLEYLGCYNETDWNLFEIYYDLLENNGAEPVYAGFNSDNVYDDYDYNAATGNLVLYLDSTGHRIISKSEAMSLEEYKTYSWDYYPADAVNYDDNQKNKRYKTYKNKQEDENPVETNPFDLINVVAVYEFLNGLLEAIELLKTGIDAYKQYKELQRWTAFLEKQKETIDFMVVKGAAVEEILEVEIILPEYVGLYNSVGIATTLGELAVNTGAIATTGEVIIDYTVMVAVIRAMEIMSPVVVNNLIVCAQLDNCIEAGYIPAEYHGLDLEGVIQDYKSIQMTEWCKAQRLLEQNDELIGDYENAEFLFVHILDFVKAFSSASVGLDQVAENFMDMSLDEGSPLFFLLSSISSNEEKTDADVKLVDTIITSAYIEEVNKVASEVKTDEEKLRDIARLMADISNVELNRLMADEEESNPRLSVWLHKSIDHLGSPYKEFFDIGTTYIEGVIGHFTGIFKTYQDFKEDMQSAFMPPYIKKVVDAIEEEIYSINRNIVEKIKEGVDWLDEHAIDIFEQLRDKAIDIYEYLENKAESIYDAFKESISGLFDNACKALPPRVLDPLVIDLEEKGIELISKDENDVHFDLDVNGFMENVTWINGTDGFLAIDRNKNGKIDDGTELFGDRVVLSDGRTAASGFEVLLDMDVNGDGIIDARDPVFSDLLIWKDKEKQGITEEGELTTLSENNIKAISLQFKDAQSEKTEGGAFITESSTVIFNDDSETDIVEYWFDTNAYDTVTVNPDGSTVSHSFGTMPGIREALENDEKGTLSGYYDDFKESNSFTEKRIIARKFLFELSGVNDLEIEPNSRGGNVDARELYIIEKCMGESFVGVSGENPNVTAAVILKDMYRKIEMMYFNLLNEDNDLSGYADLISVRTDENGKTVLDTDMIDTIIDLKKESGDRADELMYNVGAYLKSFDDANNTGYYEKFRNRYLDADDRMDDVINSGVIIGTVYGETISGTNGNDIITGFYGDDVIKAGNGNDTIYDEYGDSVMYGGSGNDTYIFNEYHGEDVIVDHEGKSRILFENGLGADDYRVSVDAKKGLVLENEETGDSLSLQEFFLNPDNYSFVFDGDSKVLGGGKAREEITASEEGGELELGDGFNVFYGGSGEDTMLGGENMDFMYGGAGNDTLHGRNGVNVLFGEGGNDKLYCGDHGSYMNGGADDDELYGGGGNDVLDGGTGDDYLQGDHGDDSYIFRRGYGHDTISESSGNNTVLIYGYSAGQMVNTRNAENDLIIGFRDSEDTLTIKRFFDFNSNRDFNFEFENGTVIGQHDMPVHNSLITGTDENNYLNGTDRNDIIDGGLGNDSLNGFGGEDTYIFGRGYGEDMINEWGSDHSFVDLKDINSDEITVSDQWGSNLLISVNDTEDVLTVSNFKWGQASYTFRFADGAEGYVDKNTWELVLTKQPEIKEEPATEELISEEVTADETDTL